MLKTFWLLAGASTTGAALGSVLHNAFYALATVTGNPPILHGTMEVAFFVIAVLLCPVAFLVGTVGAIVLLVRRRAATAA